METMQESPLLEENLEVMDKETLNEFEEKGSSSKIWYIGLGLCGLLFIGMITGMVLAFSPKNSWGVHLQQSTNDLPGCDIYSSFSCSSSSGDMDPKWKEQQWNTPPRGNEKWLPGFQDMSVLTGYPRLQYQSGLKSCTVTVFTKTAKSLNLKYEFDGVVQTSPSKTFDSSYNKQLKIRVLADSGEVLVLDDVDFAWNSAAILNRPGDYRNGQKGAIVELFGWPDADIAEECKNIAEAGYLGVKVFPHQEQVMSYQPFNNELNPWYFMYQPVSYRLQGRMGDRNTLRNMINKCRSYGVRVYADAVVNHLTGNGNDLSEHRNPGAGCTTWGNKTSSAALGSPYYTPAYTYKTNPWNGRGTNVLEYPAVPYGPMDFHCDKPLNSWNDPNLLNTGWLSGLADLDTSKDYVRERIADFFVDLLSIGFSGFRVDAAKHIHPTDLGAIFGKLKNKMGGNLPIDFITWLEVLTGGESYLLVQGDGDYSFTGGLRKRLVENGLNDNEINMIKIWWSGYPTEPHNDQGSITSWRKVVQNDDHDQQNEGSSSRDMHDDGCVLVKGCDPNKHRSYEIKLFESPYGSDDNDNDYPIRCVLSSYYFADTSSGRTMAPPDGKSDCSQCTVTCQGCRSRTYIKAYQPNAQAYSGSDYTRVHRDPQIIAAMRRWMHL